MSWTFEATRAGYARLWRDTTVKAGTDDQNAEHFAALIIASEARYRAVQGALGVPWFFIGALHMREASCSFAGVLHNGEHIIGTGAVTSKVPAGRGPFPTWEASAEDALRLKGLDKIAPWPVERMLYVAELYNGLGYVGKVNSPYVWAGTNHEQKGKFVADHQFDPNAEDTQLGVAAVLKRLAEKRPDIAAALEPTSLPATVGTVEVLDPLRPDPAGGANQALLQVIERMTARLAQPQQPQIDIGAILDRVIKLQPPPAAPPPLAKSTPPSVPFSLGAGGISTILMALGQVGTPFGLGQSPTTAGTLSVLIPAIAALVGNFGGLGWVDTALKVLGGLWSAMRAAGAAAGKP